MYQEKVLQVQKLLPWDEWLALQKAHYYSNNYIVYIRQILYYKRTIYISFC